VKVSVVIPSYNQAPFIARAIESIIHQNYEAKEIIIIDGGSTDGTQEVIEQYTSLLYYYVSEPDQGQSDALRKGFGRANGDVLAWLNSDDILIPGALTSAMDLFRSSRNIRWVVGNIVWIDENDRIVKCRKGERWSRLLADLGYLTPIGPSSFFHRELYAETGGIDEKLHYTMDTDLWWRFVRHGVKYARTDAYLWGFRIHPMSKTSGHMFRTSAYADPEHRWWKEYALERERIASQNYPTTALRSLALLRRPMVLTRRALDTNYHRGLIDSVRLRGRHVDVLGNGG
jgi:glycosyltransferase involved in cell wall biosynthesis